MCHRTPPIQQPGPRQEEGAGTDGCGAARPGGAALQPIDEGRVGRRGVHALTARHDERVEIRVGAGKLFGGEAEARRGRHALAGPRRDDPQRIGHAAARVRDEVVRRRKHLQRARDVEQLQPRDRPKPRCFG